MLSTMGNIYSADDILKYLPYFSKKTGFNISCKVSPLESICMKCQILFCFFVLFFRKLDKKNNEFVICRKIAMRVVKVNPFTLVFLK